jgi:hypothetical protein
MAFQQTVSSIIASVLRLLFLIGISCTATGAVTDTPCLPDDAAAPIVTPVAVTEPAGCIDTSLSCLSFATVEAAVIHAVQRYNPCSILHDTEFLGAVLHNPAPGKGYIYTIGTGEHGENRISVRIQIPKGYRMVAFWHTHGEAHWSHAFFSATDTALADQWHLPLYLANYSGKVRVFAPGHPKISRLEARRLGLGNASGYARGTPVFDRLHF